MAHKIKPQVLAGGFLILFAVFLFIYPQNIGGVTLSVGGNCLETGAGNPTPTPNPDGVDQAFQLTGSIQYNHQGCSSCPQLGIPVYFLWANFAGANQFAETTTNTCTGGYTVTSTTPAAGTGTLTISSSLCIQISPCALINGVAQLSVSCGIVFCSIPTYTATIRFYDQSLGQGINGMYVGLSLGTTLVETTTSSGGGYATLTYISLGSYSYVYQCQSCSASYPSGSGSFIVGPNYQTTINLQSGTVKQKVSIQMVSQTVTGIAVSGVAIGIYNGTQLLTTTPLITNSSGWVFLYGFYPNAAYGFSYAGTPSYPASVSQIPFNVGTSNFAQAFALLHYPIIQTLDTTTNAPIGGILITYHNSGPACSGNTNSSGYYVANCLTLSQLTSGTYTVSWIDPSAKYKSGNSTVTYGSQFFFALLLSTSGSGGPNACTNGTLNCNLSLVFPLLLASAGAGLIYSGSKRRGFGS